MLSSRALRWAIIISICVHLLLLVSGRGFWSGWLGDMPEDDDETLAVRILPPPAAPMADPEPRPPRPAPPPLPQHTVVAKPVLQSQGPSADPGAALSTQAPATAGKGSVAPARPAAAAAVVTPSLQVVHALPGSGHMSFLVTKGAGGFIIGRAVHDWKLSGDRYELRSSIETAGLVSIFVRAKFGQTSIGRVDAQGLHPETFLDVRKDGEYRSDFDWAQGTLRLGNGSVVPLSPGAQDLLSMFYQLGLFPLDTTDTTELALMVTTGRKFERYVFHIDGQESLMLNPNTDDHLTPTYHLSYRGREQEGVDVWLARDLARLPVKIRYTDHKGGVVEMIAQTIKYQGQP